MYKIKVKRGKWDKIINETLVHEQCPNPKCGYTGTLFYPLTMRQPSCNKCDTALKGAIIKNSEYARVDYFLGLRGYDKYSHSV
jgi:hypothetical protein